MPTRQKAEMTIIRKDKGRKDKMQKGQKAVKYGAGEILPDNGGEFRNELLGELCRLMGVSRSFTTAYHAR